MRLQRNFYEILGLPRTASQQDIKRKYHELARQFHPDRAQDKELAQRLFVQINQAYQVLIDPEKRTTYDNSLLAGTATARPAKPKAAPAAVVTPAQLEIWMGEANDAYLRGDREAAAKLCNRVLRADHKSAEAYQLMGDMYTDKGQTQEALTAYRTASSFQPANLMLQNKIQRLEAAAAKPANAAATTDRAAPERAGKTPRQNGRGPAPKHSFFGRLIGKVKSS